MCNRLADLTSVYINGILKAADAAGADRDETMDRAASVFTTMVSVSTFKDFNLNSPRPMSQWIRCLDDDEMAEFFTQSRLQQKRDIIKTLQSKGAIGEVEWVEIPSLLKKDYLAQLQRMMGGETK